MRRIIVIVAVAALVAAGTAIGIRAQTAPAKPSMQQLTQKLLQTRAADHMTFPARAALGAVANGNRQFGQDAALSSSQPAVRGNAPIRRGAPPTAPGMGNVRVNNPGEDTHQSSQTTQSETSIAVSGKNVAVGFNDSQSTLLFFTPGTNLDGYAYSRNGGQTWIDGGVLPNASGGTIDVGDPWLAADRAGNMYYSTLVDDPFVGLEVGVAKSSNGGQSWTAPIVIAPPPPANPANTVFFGADKDSLFSAGSGLYDTWDDFTGTVGPDGQLTQVLSGLTLARSTDGGQTWSSQYVDQIPAFDASQPCSFHQYIGAQSIVGPDGTVYVASLRFDLSDTSGPPCSNALPNESEYVFASHDGGATFGPGVKIADVTSSTQNLGAFVLGPAQYMRNVEFPTLAFLGKTLYVTWNDGGDGSGHSHIRLARSTDGGATWSTSWVTSGSNDEAQPAISSDSSGLHIAYYEISGTGDGTSVLDVMVANSTDGSSFTTRRVTNQSFPGALTIPNFDPIIAFAYMGDYIANVSDGTHQYFAWGDNRDVVTDFLYPQGRHDPDVFFALQ